jgi:hypothetical protein
LIRGAEGRCAGFGTGVELITAEPVTRATRAHLAPRAQGGCDDPDCVVPLCWMHHRAYDTGALELLRHLEPEWRIELVHAVLHLGPDRRFAALGARTPLRWLTEDLPDGWAFRRQTSMRLATPVTLGCRISLWRLASAGAG